MIFLRLKRHRVRKNGVRSVLAHVIEKSRRSGPVESEQKISVKRDVLLIGAHASGKSKWLERLQKEAPAIWRNRQSIMIHSGMPLAHWVEHHAEVRAHAEKLHGKRWTALRSWERVDALVAWVEEVRPVVLFDDADKIMGRKLQTALRILSAADRVVVACGVENRIPITFRLQLAKRLPQRFELRSQAAYDVTQYVLWLVLLAAIIGGAWEISAAAAGLSFAARGRTSARQN